MPDLKKRKFQLWRKPYIHKIFNHDMKKMEELPKSRCPMNSRVSKNSKVGTNPANGRGAGIVMVLDILNWLYKDSRAWRTVQEMWGED